MKKSKQTPLEWWYRLLRYVGLCTLGYHRKYQQLEPFVVVEIPGFQTLISVQAFVAVVYKTRLVDSGIHPYRWLEKIVGATLDRGGVNVPFTTSVRGNLIPNDLQLMAPTFSLEWIRFSVVELRCGTYPSRGWRWNDTYPRFVLTIDNEDLRGGQKLLHVITEKDIKRMLGQ